MIAFLKELIVQAGKICIEYQPTLNSSNVDFKGKKDLVTIADKTVEDFLIDHINKTYPSHDIFGEETGKTNRSSDYLWIIDPIDGTTSYFHQQPYYSISIAVQQNRKTICGAVYAPALKELFYADRKNGAFLNETPIHVSKTDLLLNSVMATGFACLRDGLKNNNLYYLNKILPDLRDIRRCGSAAIDLCYVACGRFDGFWEMCLNPYDVAAGAFIVEMAGGKVCDFNGTSNYPGQGIIATPPQLQSNLLEYFKKEK